MRAARRVWGRGAGVVVRGTADPHFQITEAVDAVSQEQILGLLKRFPLTSPLVIGVIGPRTEEELIGDALTAR